MKEEISLGLQIIAGVLLPVATAIYTWIATRDKDNFVHSPNCHFSYVATNPACLQIQARTSRITSDVNAESRIY